ncbi:unnamed protein product [Adineta steineri]|uniref:Uncharacterized protein n=1 Tax=Adineta steineri TaxID=433720 RepID=A0A814BQ56_9BILA|nr:unnamed protein product [Adineta steineri]
MYYLDQVYVIQPHVVKLHRHRLREEIRQPSSMTKSSSNSILHVTIRSQNSAYTTGKKFNNEQKQLQLNSTQRSKDLIRSANVYGIGSGGHGFLKNKVEPEKSFDSFKSSIKSDVSPSGDLYKADRNRDETTLQLDEFLGNKSPNSINNDSEINKNYPRAVTPDRLFLMNGVRKRKFKNQLRKKHGCSGRRTRRDCSGCCSGHDCSRRRTRHGCSCRGTRHDCSGCRSRHGCSGRCTGHGCSGRSSRHDCSGRRTRHDCSRRCTRRDCSGCRSRHD